MRLDAEAFKPVALTVCAIALLTATSASAQFVQQGPLLTEVPPHFSGEYYGFGSSVGLSGDGNTLVTIAFQAPVGIDAYVWIRSGTVWQQQAALQIADFNVPVGAVAISGDGNTIIVGDSPVDGEIFSPIGSAWIWRRNGVTWVQDGPPLVGSGQDFGHSVALSYDGTTAIIGEPGTAWIWSRQNGSWTQAAELHASDEIGFADQGIAVSLSADGSTALVGGSSDNGFTGAAWIWTRSANGWREAAKLVASTASREAFQGASVALSGDGQTALVGGPDDGPIHSIGTDTGGAAWIWSNSGGTWTESAKLVASDATLLGSSVALSDNGGIAIAGGPGGRSSGGAWIWIRSGTSWTQIGGPLIGSGDVVQAGNVQHQGVAVALSADGTTAVSSDTDTVVSGVPSGALWVFVSLPTPLTPLPDMDGDGLADLTVWQPLTGEWTWITAATGFNPSRAGSWQWGRVDHGDVPISGDVDGDGIDDLVIWRGTTGTWFWLTSSSGFVNGNSVQWGASGDTPFSADLDGDGRMDLVVWRPSNGTWYWLTSSSDYAAAGAVQWGNQSFGDTPLIGDFDGDGRSDLAVWRASTGTWYWLTSSTHYNVASARSVQWGNQSLGDVPLVADFDGDRKADLAVWRATTGTWYWLTSSSNYSVAAADAMQWGALGDVPLAGDLDGDGRADLIVWRPSSGTWFWLPSRAGYAYQSSREAVWPH